MWPCEENTPNLPFFPSVNPSLTALSLCSSFHFSHFFFLSLSLCPRFLSLFICFFIYVSALLASYVSFCAGRQEEAIAGDRAVLQPCSLWVPAEALDWAGTGGTCWGCWWAPAAAPGMLCPAMSLREHVAERSPAGCRMSPPPAMGVLCGGGSWLWRYTSHTNPK